MNGVLDNMAICVAIFRSISSKASSFNENSNEVIRKKKTYKHEQVDYDVLVCVKCFDPFTGKGICHDKCDCQETVGAPMPDEDYSHIPTDYGEPQAGTKHCIKMISGN